MFYKTSGFCPLLSKEKYNIIIQNKCFDEYRELIKIFTEQMPKDYGHIYNLITCSNFRHLNVENDVPRHILPYFYSMISNICQYYIFGQEDNIKDKLPDSIGYVYHSASKLLGLKPCLTYASIILYNFTIENYNINDMTIDQLFENINCIYNISEYEDQIWFMKIHIAIELIGGIIIDKYNTISDEKEFLHAFNENMYKITSIINTMHSKVDKNIFFNGFRPFLKGYNSFKDGMKIHNEILYCVGGSGAQSTTIQALDNIMKVEHDMKHEGKILMDIREYMPYDHRMYLLNMRTFQFKTEDYDVSMKIFQKFRKCHLHIAHKYIKSDNIGTGGTEIDNFLGSIIKNMNSYKTIYSYKNVYKYATILLIFIILYISIWHL